ncbi:MAG TPA: hypothetical protein PK264_12430 [Hyphomicrobiaceae bacterium]|nr:hypothetical protein [Hyphomicrobiaceae bacterium]
MTNTSIGNLAAGFIAAALSVLLIHQGMQWVLTQTGLVKLEPWSFKPVGPFSVPTLVNSIFWGGLWGLLFALVWDKVPGSAMWIKGLIYGFVILLISNWTLLPLIKGKIFGQANQALFAGFVPARMLAGLLILGAFGAGTGAIYSLLRSRD